MAEENCRKRLREESTCSICLDYFRDPVILDCGHNFCKACITRCLKKKPKSQKVCPKCSEMIQKKILVNRQLANMVQVTKELNDLPSPREAHQEPLKAMMDNKGHPWVHCEGCKENPARVNPGLSEMLGAQRTRGMLPKKREISLLYKAEDKKKSQDPIKLMEAEKKKTTAAFGELRQFLEEQDKHLLALKEAVEEAARIRNENLAKNSGKVSSPEGLVEENQQQSENELLQNFPNVVDGNREKVQNPVALPAELKRRIHDFQDLNLFLEATVKQFKETLIPGLQLQKVNVILDPDTAHPQLILSEDRKSIRWSDKVQDLPNNPERFDKWPVVLGCGGFPKGRYFWEVAVGSEEEWMVGAILKSAKRKGSVDLSKEGICALRMREGKYWAIDHCGPLCLPFSGEIRRIRVILNSAGGQMAFFDADSGVQLFQYSTASFFDHPLLPYFYLRGKAHLTISS